MTKIYINESDDNDERPLKAIATNKMGELTTISVSEVDTVSLGSQIITFCVQCMEVTSVCSHVEV